MIDAKKLTKEIEIPENVEVMVDEIITVKGEKGENSKRLFYPTVKISKKDKIEAINYAEENNHNHLINKLNG